MRNLPTMPKYGSTHQRDMDDFIGCKTLGILGVFSYFLVVDTNIF